MSWYMHLYYKDRFEKTSKSTRCQNDIIDICQKKVKDPESNGGFISCLCSLWVFHKLQFATEAADKASIGLRALKAKCFPKNFPSTLRASKGTKRKVCAKLN